MYQTDGRYHVVLDFLQHVVVGHDQVFGRVPVSDVGEDAQRLEDAKTAVMEAEPQPAAE